jgi:hypothetical protein
MNVLRSIILEEYQGPHDVDTEDGRKQPTINVENCVPESSEDSDMPPYWLIKRVLFGLGPILIPLLRT